MDAPAKAKAKAKAKTQADAAFAKAINRAVVAKTVAYGKAGFPAPPPLENACGLCGTPPAAQAAAAPAAGAFAAHAMAAPPARTWRERSRINQAKAPAWPIGVDHHMVANSRAQELNTAFQQTWIAVKSTNKRMRVIDNDFDAKTTRPNAIPNMVANALDTIDDTAAAVFGPIVP
eukprot:GEMP01048555.1.p1 GENE.GEMP01048555.1~~GEMP01048555.1.p1  ORF type:complete len:175 (+),score=51.93 GEMP01048555.1:127-651(+)